MTTFLALKELEEVMASDNKVNLFVCGKILTESEIVILVSGDVQSVNVPFSWFKPSGDGITPDFNNFSIIDYGHTIKFGDYEASGSAILKEFKRV